ncbi:MAG: SDR family oxidoreductase [Gammaproteobacteria bacterium]|nr:SDR family oxidoreductase [Gammaproteobacteria bacterium]
MKILVLGVTGMLGNAMFHVMTEDSRLDVVGTLRNSVARRYFANDLAENILSGIDVQNVDALVEVFATVQPDVVINCIGVIKQTVAAKNPLEVLPINALLPHRLAHLCQAVGARLIHISTDCVFSGDKGSYVETDVPDAQDLYGRAKLLGEVVDVPHAITLRTSIIGHELSGFLSLLEWFLAQQGSAKGFTRAIFSGLPTYELSRVVRDFVLPRRQLSGLYHVAAAPINKFDLLTTVAKVYGKTITINPSEELVIDRSLDASRFNRATGYHAPDWPTLIQGMQTFNNKVKIRV